jgi:hypothetical protein
LLRNFLNQIKKPCKYLEKIKNLYENLFFSYDHVDKLVHNATIDGDAWQPLINYRRILNDEPGGGHGPKIRASTGTRGRKRAIPQDGKEILFF